MVSEDDFLVRFWGVRGSIPCPGTEYARYGGNTSCIEVRVGGRLLIFDCGTGLRPLGKALIGEGPLDADIFLTHTHVDHIHGIPFFKPFFSAQNRFRMWAGHLNRGHRLADVLGKYMAKPLFPVPPAIFEAEMDYRDFAAGDTLDLGAGLELQTAMLNHPQGSTGYRVNYGGRSFCYITDTEHREGELDQTILSLVEGAQVMVYDASYTDEEYPLYRGWGHSTWQEGVRLAVEAKVEELVIFHHDPSHDDDEMDRIAEESHKMWRNTRVARERRTIHL